MQTGFIEDVTTMVTNTFVLLSIKTREAEEIELEPTTDATAITESNGISEV